MNKQTAFINLIHIRSLQRVLQTDSIYSVRRTLLLLLPLSLSHTTDKARFAGNSMFDEVMVLILQILWKLATNYINSLIYKSM